MNNNIVVLWSLAEQVSLRDPVMAVPQPLFGRIVFSRRWRCRAALGRVASLAGMRSWEYVEAIEEGQCVDSCERMQLIRAVNLIRLVTMLSRVEKCKMIGVEERLSRRFGGLSMPLLYEECRLIGGKENKEIKPTRSPKLSVGLMTLM